MDKLDLTDWAIVTADGGSRWYVGKVTQNGSDLVTLNPVYGYHMAIAQQGQQVRVSREVAPLLMLASPVGLELRWTARTWCRELLDVERDLLEKDIKTAEARRSEIRSSLSGLKLVGA